MGLFEFYILKFTSFSKSNISISGLTYMMARGVQQTWWPAQLGQPARVRLATIRSDDSSGRTRVSNSLPQPHAGQLSVFPFETRDTRPEPNPFSFQQVITTFWPFSTKSSLDPSRSGKISPLSDEIWARSRLIQPDFGLISLNPTIFRPDLDDSGHISAWSHQILPYFSLISPDPTIFRPRW